MPRPQSRPENSIQGLPPINRLLRERPLSWFQRIRPVSEPFSASISSPGLGLSLSYFILKDEKAEDNHKGDRFPTCRSVSPFQPWQNLVRFGSHKYPLLLTGCPLSIKKEVNDTGMKRIWLGYREKDGVPCVPPSSGRAEVF